MISLAILAAVALCLIPPGLLWLVMRVGDWRI